MKAIRVLHGAPEDLLGHEQGVCRGPFGQKYMARAESLAGDLLPGEPGQDMWFTVRSGTQRTRLEGKPAPGWAGTAGRGDVAGVR